MGIRKFGNDVADLLGWESPFPDEDQDLLALVVAFAINPEEAAKNQPWLQQATGWVKDFFTGTIPSWFNSAIEWISSFEWAGGYQRPEFLESLGSSDSALTEKRAATFDSAKISPELAKNAATIIQEEAAGLMRGWSVRTDSANKSELTAALRESANPRLKELYLRSELSKLGITLPGTTSVEDIEEFLSLDGTTSAAGEGTSAGQLLLQDSVAFASSTIKAAEESINAGNSDLNFSAVSGGRTTTDQSITNIKSLAERLVAHETELRGISLINALGIKEDDWYDLTVARENDSINDNDIAALKNFSEDQIKAQLKAQGIDSSKLSNILDNITNIDAEYNASGMNAGTIRIFGNNEHVDLSFTR